MILIGSKIGTKFLIMILFFSSGIIRTTLLYEMVGAVEMFCAERPRPSVIWLSFRVEER